MTHRYGIPEQENVNTENSLQRRTPADMESDSIARWSGDAQIVLLGESPQGSREFYQVRADEPLETTAARETGEALETFPRASSVGVTRRTRPKA